MKKKSSRRSPQTEPQVLVEQEVQYRHPGSEAVVRGPIRIFAPRRDGPNEWICEFESPERKLKYPIGSGASPLMALLWACTNIKYRLDQLVDVHAIGTAFDIQGRPLAQAQRAKRPAKS